MSDVKVSFTIDSPKGKFSFTAIEEINQEDLREKVLELVINWDRNAKETAITHLLRHELGQERAKTIGVEFKIHSK